MLKGNLRFNLVLIFGCSILMLFQLSYTSAENFNDSLGSLRIINGSDASLSASKHQVSIRRRLDESLLSGEKSFGDGHICGGSLISENVVLTAAHCFTDSSGNGTFSPKEDFIVVMGTLNRTEPNNNTLVFDIMKFVKHDDKFNTTTLADDIILVLLNGRVPANHSTAQQVVLNEGPIKNNMTCQTTGWGINENKVRSKILQIVDQPYIPFTDCLKKTTYGAQLSQGMLCAGFLEGGRGPCTADSGGPMVCQGIQAGIVSWGGKCATPLNPTVYADVAYYKNWILKELVYHNASLPKFASIAGGNKGLSSSIILISLTITFNFFYSQME